MKQIKTDHRNRMKTSTLSTLLTVKLHSNSVEDFELNYAIEQWYRSKSRKIHFNATKMVRNDGDADLLPAEAEEEAGQGLLLALEVSHLKLMMDILTMNLNQIAGLLVLNLTQYHWMKLLLTCNKLFCFNPVHCLVLSVSLFL